MSFDWKQYIDLGLIISKKKFDNCNIESCLRVAISRYYYGAFCLSRNYLLDKNRIINKKNSDMHFNVKEVFANSNRYEEKQIAKDLCDLHGYRKLADYENNIKDIESIFTFAECCISSILENFSIIDANYWGQKNIILKTNFD